MVGTVEDYAHLFQKKKEEPEDAPALSKFDKDIIGAAVRFEVPIADAELRELEAIGDILVGLGNRMKLHAQRRMEKNPPSEREIKFSIRVDASESRQKIRDVTPGLWNRNGTVKG